MTETETKTSNLLSRLPDLQECKTPPFDSSLNAEEVQIVLQGGKVPPIDANLTAELVQTLLQGGKQSIVGLIDALREVDNGADWKARLLLQALTMAVGTPEQAVQRQMLADVLLDEATGTRPSAVRIFLLARLRLIADKDAVKKLIPLFTAADPQLAEAAATVLVSIGQPSKEPLAEALKAAQGRSKEVIEYALAQIH